MMTLQETAALIAKRGEDETEIERIMDRYTWDGFIDMLTQICHEKAEHVATHSGKRDPAVKGWTVTASAFERVRKCQPYEK